MTSQPGLILHNASVHTLDDAMPHATAIAIRDGQVLAIGNDSTVLATAAPDAKVNNLQGKTVIPGLTDSHGHLRNLGRVQEHVQLYDTRSFEEVVERIRARAKDTPLGQWIVGRGWNQELWPGASMPTHHILSKAIPNHPVWLLRVDAHAGLANAAAMQEAGLDSSVPEIHDGAIVKEGGRLTGLFIDNAIRLITSRMPAPDLEQNKQWYLKAQEICLANGLTEVHEAGVSEIQLQALRELVREDRLKLRVYAMLERTYFDNARHTPFTEGNLTCRSVKIITDGALGSRGAALIQSYTDAPSEKGSLLLTGQELRATVDKAFRSGFQVNTHAIGDHANRITLDTIESALRDNPIPDHRSRIEHAQIIALDDIPRFAKLGIIASVQPTHCTSDMNMAEARLGPQRIKGAYAWRKLLDSGVRLASGSDFPVESPNPMLGLYAAVTRQDSHGNPAGGWHSEERLTMNEALHSFTTGAAYASFQENHKGTLTPGKCADLLILDTDVTSAPPPDLLKAKVLATIINGQPVHIRIPNLNKS